MGKPRCPKCKITKLVITRYKWGDQVFFGRYMPAQTKSSLVRCIAGHEWRTAAGYVDSLPMDEGADLYSQAVSIGNEGV